MPWQHLDLMSQRTEFAFRALQTENFRALCREYGISPRVGYKWKNRLLEEGMGRMEERSRRPKTTPQELNEDIVCEMVKLRMKYMHWVARKLQEIYRIFDPDCNANSEIERSDLKPSPDLDQNCGSHGASLGSVEWEKLNQTDGNRRGNSTFSPFLP